MQTKRKLKLKLRKITDQFGKLAHPKITRLFPEKKI